MSNNAPLVLMAAMDGAGGVGLRGKIPWHLPHDLKRFQSMTLGGVLVMGGKTFAECGVLPGRTNIVLTRSMQKNKMIEFQHDAQGKRLPADTRFIYASSIADALDAFHSREPLFICGGTDVWRSAFALIARYNISAMAFITKLKGSYGCDTFFPTEQMKNWLTLLETQPQIENGHEAQLLIMSH